MLTAASRWPATLLVGAVLIPTTLLLVLVVFDIHSVIRPFLALWFLFVCPGLPYVRLLRLASLTEELLLALIASIALDMLVAGTLLYAGVWSAEASFYLLATISYLGVFASLMLPAFRD